MTESPHQSAGISPRRALLEEILRERSRVVAALPIESQDPPASSFLWPLGAARVARRCSRAGALQLAVLALAWLEAFDAES